MIQINQNLAKRLTQEQIDILIKSVEEKNEIPIRVVYTQEYWDNIAKDSDYQLANREISALKNSMTKLAEQLGEKKINIIHLGVGNGLEIPMIINGIGAKNIANYSIVDVNPTMLEMSEKKLQQNFPEITTKKFLTDIETYGFKDVCKQTKKDGAEINIIFLIANGVLFSNDELVREIYNNLDENDYFFLTLELYQEGKDKEIIKPYLIPTVLDLLGNGIKLIGYEPKYEEFSAEIDKINHLLKIYYSPSNDKTKKLLVLHSYKPNVEQLNERMGNFGFVRVFCEEYSNIHTCAGLYTK
ncbi:MAG: L-histidine N(alpha)-methyltransferase [Candidatus Komeilibacteria bacterium]|nr:L-histidine N(alpha)-methyltransferase [Candidatus Komeilibacteria bacterium]